MSLTPANSDKGGLPPNNLHNDIAGKKRKADDAPETSDNNVRQASKRARDKNSGHCGLPLHDNSEQGTGRPWWENYPLLNPGLDITLVRSMQFSRSQRPRRITGNECAWCLDRLSGSHVPQEYAATHQLDGCPWPANSGAVAGCPVCNTVAHDLDRCPTRESMTEEQRREQAFEYLVRRRGGLPPLRTTLPWPQLAVHSCFANVQLPAGYPATKTFAIEQLRLGPTRFKNFFGNCSANRHARFLDDPATASIDTIRQNLAALMESEVYIPHPQGYDPPVARVERRVLQIMDEMMSGPSSDVHRTLQAVEAWVASSPHGLLLPSPKLRRLALTTLHRLASKEQQPQIATYYMTAVLPAASVEFLCGLSGTPAANHDAMVRWLEENPDGHLGSVGDRARLLFDVRQAQGNHPQGRSNMI